MTIRAIETSYKGYRFRSRTEARWAVFFDALGVRWQYETKGYLVGPQGRPYLPDFWLPDLGTWVEVKGEMAALDVRLTEDAVSSPASLGRENAYGEVALLILGPVPEPGRAWLHTLLTRASYAPCEQFCACHDVHYSQVTFRALPPAAAGDDRRGPGAILLPLGRSLLRPLEEDIVSARDAGLIYPSRAVSDALTAARSARFEHGEQPAERPAAAEDADPVEVLNERLVEAMERRFGPMEDWPGDDES